MIYDVAVIGAGPAGATFARLAAEEGRRILLIDGQNERCKKPCGGLLAPDAQKALAHFDLTLPKSVLVDPQIFSVRTIDICRGQTRHYARHYLNIDRYAFDRWLVSLVPDTVEIFRGRCTDVQRANGVFRLTLRGGGRVCDIHAARIVGADGANSLVRKRFFPTDKVMHYVAIQQWFTGANGLAPFYSCLFDEKTSESCSWSICKDDYFIFGGCFTPKDCRAAFEAQKTRLRDALHFDFSGCVKTEACLALRPRRPRDFQTGADGVYLIGEAAGFISPSSFEGISSAILSGSLLAESFGNSTEDGEIARLYHRKTFRLRCKLTLKIAKRWFMYTPLVREWIMRTGVGSIRLWHK